MALLKWEKARPNTWYESAFARGSGLRFSPVFDPVLIASSTHTFTTMTSEYCLMAFAPNGCKTAQ